MLADSGVLVSNLHIHIRPSVLRASHRWRIDGRVRVRVRVRVRETRNACLHAGLGGDGIRTGRPSRVSSLDLGRKYVVSCRLSPEHRTGQRGKREAGTPILPHPRARRRARQRVPGLGLGLSLSLSLRQQPPSGTPAAQCPPTPARIDSQLATHVRSHRSAPIRSSVQSSPALADPSPTSRCFTVANAQIERPRPCRSLFPIYPAQPKKLRLLLLCCVL